MSGASGASATPPEESARIAEAPPTSCPEHSTCHRNGDGVPETAHCTHWYERGEVCCNCGTVLPHGWWRA